MGVIEKREPIKSVATDYDAAPTSAIDGFVVIFGSTDEDIAGDTLATLKLFTAGALSPEQIRKKRFRDPLDAFPELLHALRHN